MKAKHLNSALYSACLWLFLCLFLVPPLQAQTNEKRYAKDPIRDLALIYQGGAHRLDWTEEQFTPFVAHQFEDGRRDWLFDGFLFLEFATGKGRTYAMGFAETSARKQEWELLLDRLFEEHRSLSALDQSIESVKQELGEPPFKHQVVLGLPMPHEHQKDWGEFGGEVMDFTNQKNQLKVLDWYLEELNTRFESQDYKNLELQGYYWVEEDTIYSKDITVPLKQRIQQMDKRFYWIPYWKARGHAQWKEMGFDIAYLQPNHFFQDTIPDQRLEDACLLAGQLEMAMEMEFDKHARFEATNSSHQRMVSYLDYFERNGVLANSAIAYYSGTDGFLKMIQSTHPKDIALMDRLARMITGRRHNPLLELKEKREH